MPYDRALLFSESILDSPNLVAVDHLRRNLLTTTAIETMRRLHLDS
jgi:hypothetical protein